MSRGEKFVSALTWHAIASFVLSIVALETGHDAVFTPLFGLTKRLESGLL